MQIIVQGKQMEIGTALQDYVQTHLPEKVGKYFEGDAVDATVIFHKESYFTCCDIIVHPGLKSLTINAKATADEPHPAFDAACELIAKRLRRYKTRLKDHHGPSHADLAEAQQARSSVLDLDATYSQGAANDSGAVAEPDAPAVIAEMTTPLMTLTVSEAVMNLELGHLPALLFRNKANGGLNMLYRRADGNLGWVDPQEGAQQVAPPKDRTQAA